MGSEGWEKTKLNTVNRYRNRGKYDYETVNTIVDETSILHVSFPAPPSNSPDEPPYPVTLPMMGVTSAYPSAMPSLSKDESRHVYLHGYISSRLMRLSKKKDDTVTNGHSGDATTTNGLNGGSSSHGTTTNGASTASPTDSPPSHQSASSTESGTPVCVCATHFDGIVLALTPNHHSMNYRSAIIYGRASLVEDESERLHAMELITNNLVPHRWQNTRYPNATELKSTGIIRVEIDSASAKIRTGNTGEDRKDLKDEEMRKKVWNGVVPVRLMWGDPVEAPTNMHKGTPKYIKEWVDEENARGDEYMLSAAQP